MKWERRTEFINGVPIFSFEPVPVRGGGVDFDGGVREPAMPVVSTADLVGHFLRHGSTAARSEGDGWHTIDLG